MLRPYQKINRRKTRVVNVGNILIGGNNPITVQTMTNTLTSNVDATTKQISRVIKAGADLVRVSVDDIIFLKGAVRNTEKKGMKRDLISPRSKFIALVLLIFFSGTGAHRFYAGKWGTGFLYLLLSLH